MKTPPFLLLALGGLALAGCATDAINGDSPSATTAPIAVPPAPFSEEPPLLGGYSDISTSDPDAMAAAQAAVEVLGEGWVLQEVLSAQAQVVAGMNHRVVFTLAKGGKTGRAEATVWKKLDGTREVTERKWLEKPEVEEAKPGLPGGFSPVNVSDEGAVSAAKAAAKGFEAGWVFKKLVSAKSQVVAGTNYELVIALGKGGQEGLARATVWRKLDGSLAVTQRGWLEKPEEELKTLPEGFVRIKTSDPAVQKAARAVLAKVGGGWKLDKVVSAHATSAKPIQYRFTFFAKNGAETKKGIATVSSKADGSLEVQRWRWE